MKGIDETLRQQAKYCKWLVLWLDYDREGENISFEVISRCKMGNSNLQIFRAKFSSLLPRFLHNYSNIEKKKTILIIYYFFKKGNLSCL